MPSLVILNHLCKTTTKITTTTPKKCSYLLSPPISSIFYSCRSNYYTVLFTILLVFLVLLPSLCFLVQSKQQHLILLKQMVTILDSRCPILLNFEICKIFFCRFQKILWTFKNQIKLNSYNNNKIRLNKYNNSNDDDNINNKCPPPSLRANSTSAPNVYIFALTKLRNVIIDQGGKIFRSSSNSYENCTTDENCTHPTQQQQQQLNTYYHTIVCSTLAIYYNYETDYYDDNDESKKTSLMTSENPPSSNNNNYLFLSLEFFHVIYLKICAILLCT
jgi:hypothetical protein